MAKMRRKFHVIAERTMMEAATMEMTTIKAVMKAVSTEMVTKNKIQNTKACRKEWS
jgi:Zn finger protein HypA/HybF involved in hydrogenase expression